MEAEQVFGADAVARLRDHLGEPGTPIEVVPPPPPPSGVVDRTKRAIKAVIRRGIGWYVDVRADDAAASVARQLTSRIEAVRDEARPDQEQKVEVRALTVNFELLKGELRSVQTIMEDLATAIAPATGLPDVSDRMAELRERVNALDRRVRQLRQSGPAGDHPDVASSEITPPAPAAASSESFDYVAFDRLFRGDPVQILQSARD